MSVEQKFPKTAYWSTVNCPFCCEDKPVIANGLVKVGKDVKMMPDRGYAFCNCKNIWYCDWKENDEEALDEEQTSDVLKYHLNLNNIKLKGYQRNKLLIAGNNTDKLKEEACRLGFNLDESPTYNVIWLYHQIEKDVNPTGKLKEYYHLLDADGVLFIASPDPFFIEFENIYSWEYWFIRRNFIMWDMDSFIEELEKIGFKVKFKMRNTEVNNDKDFHLVLEK